MFKRLVYTGKIIRTFFVSDQYYLKKRFIQQLGYIPNFEQPQSFNEKVNARMIYERNPIHTKLADKLAVREIIKDKIGENYLVPLLGVYKKFTDINFETLPKQFVLKCNHDSGSAIVCVDKARLDPLKTEAKVNNYLMQNMYVRKREWHYKNISPMILAEQFVQLYSNQEFDYTITTCRFHCFEGKPTFIELDIYDNKNTNYTNIYNTAWELEQFSVDQKENSPFPVEKPTQLNEMLFLSEILCFEYGYSRIDFLICQNQIYFSEITLTPNAGRMKISPIEWDKKLGSYWLNF